MWRFQVVQRLVTVTFTQTSEEIEDIFIGMATKSWMENETLQLRAYEPSKTIYSWYAGYFLHHRRNLCPYPHVSSSGAMDAHDFSKGPWRWSHQDVQTCRDTDEMRPTVTTPQIEGLVAGKTLHGWPSWTLQLIVQKCWWRARLTASIIFPIHWAICWGWRFMLQVWGDGCNVCKKTGWIDYGCRYGSTWSWDEWASMQLLLLFAFGLVKNV